MAKPRWLHGAASLLLAQPGLGTFARGALESTSTAAAPFAARCEVALRSRGLWHLAPWTFAPEAPEGQVCDG